MAADAAQGALLQAGALAQAQAARRDAEGEAPQARARRQGQAPRGPESPNAEKPEQGAKTPFYKRQLSLKREAAGVGRCRAGREAEAEARAGAAAPDGRRFPARGSKKKIVGLKIGGSQIAAARVNNGGSPELVQAVRAPLEQGIVVGGELRDPEALAVALKEFFPATSCRKRGVRLGIANNRIGVRTFEVDRHRRSEAARERDPLPCPGGAADPDRGGGARLPGALGVGRTRRARDGAAASCSSSPTASSSTATSTRAARPGSRSSASTSRRSRSCAPSPSPTIPSPAPSAAPSSPSPSATTARRSPSRTAASASSRACSSGAAAALNVAIARALDISPSEAEPIKRALSLTARRAAARGLNDEQLATAREAARRQLQTFARELVSSLQFYQNQPGSLGIGEIVLTGGTAHLPGLGAELERLIGVPVRVADPMTPRQGRRRRSTELEQLGSLAVAIGLGIED